MAETMYSIFEEEFVGEPAVVLRDLARGQEARVLPGLGNNCISYRVRQGEADLQVLHVPSDPETLRGRPSGYGVPILFPWPNRIEAGRFSFDGKSCQLVAPEPGKHVLHGFVMGRPWRVEASGASDEAGAWVRSRFRSSSFPEIAAQFPFPFEIVGTYRLRNGALDLEMEAENAGDGEMPAGLGMHPYFPLPLATSGNREACTVQVPAGRYWPLRPDCIPTGEVLPVSGRYDLRRPRPMGGEFYDDVWTGIERADGWSRCVYADPAVGVRIAVSADAAFREWVLYAPEQRPVLCFEPYTCTTNAFNLEAQGVDAGMVRLGPGERLRGTMRIAVETEGG